MNKFLLRNWIVSLSVALGIFTALPFLAPLFMHIGWSTGASWIYFIYSWLCHQLPERSFFIFGPHLTYSLAQIQSAWQVTLDPGILRQFNGNPAMGWKVAWSDRMVSMYTSLWLSGLVYWFIKRKIKPLPLWTLVLFLLPMAVDGASHFISDLSGIGRGFRDANLWLAVITQHNFPATFYIGDAMGSFNSLMRLLSGILFGIGIVWYTYPLLDKFFSPLGHQAAVIGSSGQTNLEH